jgi:hypothetical protein
MPVGQVGRDSEVSKKQSRSNPTSAADDSPELEFELIRNDIPLRWLRKVGIIPANELGTGRRAILMTLLCWVPLMLWAFLSNPLSSFAGGPGSSNGGDGGVIRGRDRRPALRQRCRSPG